MLSNKEIVCPNNLLDFAHKKKGVKVAVVNAGKPLPMLSVQDAVNENLIEPIFIGNKEEINKCAHSSNCRKISFRWNSKNYS
jgi:phosphate acetyltransferase